MVLKLKLAVALLCMCMIGCNAQPNRDDSKSVKEDLNNKDETKEVSKGIEFINNDSIEYSIVLRACDSCFPIVSHYRVSVKISDNEKELLKKLSLKEWLNLLNNENTDWGANLILYDIYNRDASLLSRRNSRELWIKFMKENDIEYWSKTLK